MKTYRYLLGLFILSAVAFSVAAQTNGVVLPEPESGGDFEGLLILLIPALVPLIIAVGKWVIPRIPKWVLPILAPALGALLDFINSFVHGSPPNPLLGATLGAAGTGLREVIDQVKQRTLGKPEPKTP